MLQAYDAHMNVVISQAEESIHIVDVTEEGQPLPPRVERRSAEMLFVRGDGVILVRMSMHFHFQGGLTNGICSFHQQSNKIVVARDGDADIPIYKTNMP